MKCSFRPLIDTKQWILLVVLAVYCFGVELQAKECVDVAKYLDDVLSKKELQIASYERAYRANSPTFTAREQRYTKAGYQSLETSERAKIINDLVEASQGEKAVFDLRLNSLADELPPMLRANRNVQIVDPKIVDGKLIAKLNGSESGLAHTIELPLESIDNFAFWRGAARSGERQVVSFSDSSGKALEDFMKSVGPNKAPQDYTRAFKELGSDWNYQNDILAAIEKKVASGTQLSRDEFALAMMVERNRTQAAPARLNELLSAYDARVDGLRGSAPNADDLLKDIPMDASMRARAQRLLSNVEGERLPPAVITESTSEVAQRASVRATTDDGPRVITDQSAKRLTPERVKVDVETPNGRMQGEILHASDPGPRPGARTIPHQADEPLQAAAGADDVADASTDIATRTTVPKASAAGASDEALQAAGGADELTEASTDLATRADIADAENVARATDDDEIRLITDQSPERLTPERMQVDVDTPEGRVQGDLLHDSDPGPRPGFRTVGDEAAEGTTDVARASDDVARVSDDVAAAADDTGEGLTLMARMGNTLSRWWDNTKNFAASVRRNPTPAVRTATTAGRVAHAEPTLPERGTASDEEDNLDDSPPEETAPPPQEEAPAETEPPPEVAPGTLSPDQAREALAKINLAVNLNEETRLRPTWEVVMETTALEDTPESQEILKQGYMEVICQQVEGVSEDCTFNGGVGETKFTKNYKRLIPPQDYRVVVNWVYKASDGNEQRIPQAIAILPLDCDDIPEDDSETLVACGYVEEETIPEFRGVTGPQLLPMPQMPQLRQRGVYITPGFN